MKRSAFETTELEAARTSSVSKYFNPVVGQHDEISEKKRDKHNNPLGASFDLGKDGAFSQFKVLIGIFLSVGLPQPIAALQKKGFKVDVVHTEKEFIDKLFLYDVVMFLSGTIADQTKLTGTKEYYPSWKSLSRVKFVEALVKYHESGKGIWAWTDNDPLFEHANALLEHFSLKMIGNTPGNKTLTLSDNTHDPPIGCFKRHVITTGVTSLYEGITISYLSNISKNKKGEKAYPYAPFKVLAQSTDGNPVSAFLDNEFIEESAGRMLVDGGFTKLFGSWDDAGSARYVVNGVIWLLGLEKKKKGATKKGTKKTSKGHWVWEWQNGEEWTLYHEDDAGMLEEKKEEGTNIFTTKELSFNAKFGTPYKFNIGAKKMTQTNTISSRVTNIRRRPAKKGEEGFAVGKPDEEEEEEEEEEEKKEPVSKKAKKSKKKEEEEEEDEEEENVKSKKTKKKPSKEEEEEEEKPKAKKAKKEEEAEVEEPKKKMVKKKPGKWVWEWQKGKKWLFFAQEDGELLEEKLQLPKLHFKTRNMSFNPQRTALYVYDLESDTQKNAETGTVTNIRRRKATADETEYAVG